MREREGGRGGENNRDRMEGEVKTEREREISTREGDRDER